MALVKLSLAVTAYLWVLLYLLDYLNHHHGGL